MSIPAGAQTDTLNAFLEAWKSGSAENTMALWSEEFTQQLLPQSLGVPGKSRTEAEFLYPKLVHNLTNWKLEIKQVVHDNDRGTAAVYAVSSADTPVPGEKWINEYAVFLSFSSDGTKVDRVQEMVDSAFYRDFFPKFQKALVRGNEHHG